MKYILAFIMDAIIVYAIVVNRDLHTITVDQIAYFAYGMIFYYIALYIVLIPSFGTSIVNHNKRK